MRIRPATLMLALALALYGCAHDSSDPTETDTEIVRDTAEVGDAGAVEEYRLTLRTALHADGPIIRFMTPTASLIEADTADYVGAPWVAAVFPAGFESGVDPALHTEWGTVPESLEFDYSPEITLPSGPYDVVLMVYASSEITDEHRNGLAPFPTNGDLSSFTIEGDVLEGDPDINISFGVVRMNIQDADTTLVLENRTSTPEDAPEIRQAAGINTFLYMP